MNLERNKTRLEPLIAKGEINFHKINTPGEMAKIRNILTKLIQEAEPDISDKVSEQIGRLRVFASFEDCLSFLETAKKRGMSPVEKLVRLIRYLGENGEYDRIFINGHKIPFVLLHRKNEATLLHELKHAAQDCMGKRDIREIKRGNHAILRTHLGYLLGYAQGAGALVFLTLAQNTNNSEAVYSVFLIGSSSAFILSFVSHQDYWNSEVEIDARATSARIKNNG